MSWNMFLCMAGCCEKLFLMFLVFTFVFVLSGKKKCFKPIKLTTKNRTAICRKTDPKRYALVLIMRKPNFIGSVINLAKQRANRTPHTPNFHWLAFWISEKSCIIFILVWQNLYLWFMIVPILHLWLFL